MPQSQLMNFEGNTRGPGITLWVKPAPLFGSARSELCGCAPRIAWSSGPGMPEGLAFTEPKCTEEKAKDEIEGKYVG